MLYRHDERPRHYYTRSWGQVVSWLVLLLVVIPCVLGLLAGANG